MNITNIKYTVNGMLFDAAVDWDWQMHIYELFSYTTATSLIGTSAWSIRMDVVLWTLTTLSKQRKNGLKK